MGRAVKELLKQGVTLFLFYSGLAWLAFAVLFRGRALALMYHRVLPASADTCSAEAIIVSTRTFDLHMRFLRRFCNPVPVERFRAMLNGEEPWLPRTCLVTFDDGWYDNIEHALPILERTRVPAVVFVATGYLGSQETFWQEQLTRLLHEAWKLGPPSHGLFEELGAPEVLRVPAEVARKHVRELVNTLKHWDRARLQALMARTRKLLEDARSALEGWGDDRFMSWQEAAKLAESGLVAVESHAHSHVPLTTLDDESTRRELSTSNREFQARLGFTPRFFAYPNGNHDGRVVERVRDAGYQLAFTTDAGWILPGAEPLGLKRINIGERGTATPHGFLCRLMGWL